LRAKDEYENLCLAAVRTNLTPKPFSVEVRRLRKGRWHPVIVMELIEGETLLCYNKSEKEKRAIGEKLDKKLRERGIFHPDLAARNIMWDKKKRMWRVVDLENVAFSYLEET
jgi:tRNA A-37 threonylcarbamoyl transferase component Bud32